MQFMKILLAFTLILATLEDTPEIIVTLQPVSPDIFWKRVMQRVQVTYTYNVVNDDKWNQFPDFALNVEVPFDQYVLISYVISFWTPVADRFYVRVKINGQQPFKALRSSHGYTNIHENYRQKQVYLKKGNYKIWVEYRTTCMKPGGQAQQDWNVAQFSVTHYETIE